MESILIAPALWHALEPRIFLYQDCKTDDEIDKKKARSTIILSLADSVIREVAKDTFLLP